MAMLGRYLGGKAPYDEEDQRDSIPLTSATSSTTSSSTSSYHRPTTTTPSWLSTSSWPLLEKGLPIPRLRKSTVILLLIDLFIVVALVHTLEPLITLLRRNEELFGPRLIPSQHDLSRPPANTAHVIPRILHQTTKNSTIPEKWVEAQKSCMKVYDDYEYKLWTDDLAREFLAAEYPWFVEYWDGYAFPIQRADAIRYFVLHHYGGLYLDMDTVCLEQFPMHLVEAEGVPHVSIFESTLPTGVTNDFMVSTARHPAFATAISKLPFYYSMTRWWAEWQPYCNIMISSGPMFITLVVKDYLLQQPSLPSPAVHVISPPELSAFITDIQSSTWHTSDAKVLMWIGEREWVWFFMGGVGVSAGLWVINLGMLILFKVLVRKVPRVAFDLKKLAKLA